MYNKLISIIMPVYNSKKYVAEAIDSVVAQTYQDWELLIIDDASTDTTEQIIQSYSNLNDRIKVYSVKKNSGTANARNIGIKHAKGEYIAFLDSDDFWHQKKLEKQIHALLDVGADMICTAYEMINGEGVKLKQRKIQNLITLDDLLKENVVIFSTALFRRASIVGASFNNKYFHEDYVFLLDFLQRQKKIMGINDVLVKYRVHNQGRSFSKINAAKYRWSIYREYMHFSILKSIYYFIFYMIYGCKKYW